MKTFDITYVTWVDFLFEQITVNIVNVIDKPDFLGTCDSPPIKLGHDMCVRPIRKLCCLWWSG